MRQARAAGLLALSVVAASCAVAGPSMVGRGDVASPRAHAHDVRGASNAALAERRRLIAEGERSLASGDALAALRSFEQAALQVHAADIELGILRAQMQAGAYRQALAFAAHTAGVHLDEVEGRVLYAWLLNLGGQTEVANQTLRLAEVSAPDQPTVKEARKRFESGVLLADGALLALPARLAPYATGVAIDREVRVVGSALLLHDGQHALAPLDALPGAAMIWLRNGLGQAVTAQVQQRHEDIGLVLLKLGSAMPAAGGEVVPPRDAFAGSPAFAVDYPMDPAGRPAWPTLRAGFLGAGLPGDAADAKRLGVDLPGQGPRGGPVYDQGGRLIGLALRRTTPGGMDQLLPVSRLRGLMGERLGTPTPEVRSQAIGADALYERALRTCLQVLVAVP
jgi:hypothetical protein